MNERPKAVLVAVKLPEISEQEFQSSLDELERLVSTLGYQTVARVTQTRTQLAPAAVLGEGKLEELKSLLRGGYGEEQEEEDVQLSIEWVIVDQDISPSQSRNLELITGAFVLDRTRVIIDIFSRHARSREAHLQVEIARLTYAVPHLRESPLGKERQQGRGAGETAFQLNRRHIRDRIAELREELAAVQQMQSLRRAQRQDTRRVAFVGYTNAGKSSLMRALTGSDVYVEDKLFATLDTTVRALQPEVKSRILLSDTVGFIKNLPHDLVASFKSTLDEALDASHLLHIVDASDPSWMTQLQVTRDVLAEIGAEGVPNTLVFNKCDRIDEAKRNSLAVQFPEAWFVSAKNPDDITSIRQRIIELFERTYLEKSFLIPYAAQRLLASMYDSGRVLKEEYEEEGVRVLWRAPATEMARMESAISKEV